MIIIPHIRIVLTVRAIGLTPELIAIIVFSYGYI